MAFRVKSDGVIECDSAKEAVELQALLMSQQKGRNAEDRGKHKRQADYKGFWRDLDSRGQSLLKVLAQTDRAMRSGELAEGSSIGTKQLSGAMVHVRHTAKKNGLTEPVHRDQQTEDRRIVSYYRLAKHVREALNGELREEKPAQ